MSHPLTFRVTIRVPTTLAPVTSTSSAPTAAAIQRAISGTTMGSSLGSMTTLEARRAEHEMRLLGPCPDDTHTSRGHPQVVETVLSDLPDGPVPSVPLRRSRSVMWLTER